MINSLYGKKKRSSHVYIYIFKHKHIVEATLSDRNLYFLGVFDCVRTHTQVSFISFHLISGVVKHDYSTRYQF